jgi:acetyl-CoA acetyltransferase
VGLAAQALQAALADAGIGRDQVDGLAWSLGRPSGEDYDTTAEALGLNLRFVNQTWTHGRFAGTCVIVAALAVESGLADFVACIGGIRRIATNTPASYGVLPHGDLRAHGFGQFADEGALALRRYLHVHGVEPSRLADVVVALRRNASLNPGAWLRTPLSRDDYLAMPFVVDPLRAADCFPANAAGVPLNDSGVCVIVGRRDALPAGSRPAVHVLAGQGLQAGREETYFGRPGLGLFTQAASSFAPTPRDLRVYDLAGLRPADVDGFYTYDAFSSLVWFALERFGHCAPGEAPRWASAERLSFDGGLPTNTNGGLIGEGHTGGWGHLVEIARQLRHEAGARQIRNASVLQWATVFGDALLFTNDRALLGRAPS